VIVVGNTKFDQPLPADADEQVASLRALMTIPEGTDVFVAGSTNPGEEEPVFDAYLRARKVFPKLRLVIAPRQIERGEEIAAMAVARGLRGARRSNLKPDFPAPEGSVIILDTIGELAVVYGLGTVAFVGGSLIPKGGHNILQPLAWGKPVFFGPHMHKSLDSAKLALGNEIGFQIASAEELGDGIINMLNDRKQLGEISSRALAVIEQNRGAATRTVKALAELLGAEAE
jgi:3-deoxy-D-manno-octulosonic-acid transferase